MRCSWRNAVIRSELVILIMYQKYQMFRISLLNMALFCFLCFLCLACSNMVCSIFFILIIKLVLTLSPPPAFLLFLPCLFLLCFSYHASSCLFVLYCLYSLCLFLIGCPYFDLSYWSRRKPNWF